MSSELLVVVILDISADFGSGSMHCHPSHHFHALTPLLRPEGGGRSVSSLISYGVVISAIGFISWSYHPFWCGFHLELEQTSISWIMHSNWEPRGVSFEADDDRFESVYFLMIRCKTKCNESYRDILDLWSDSERFHFNLFFVKYSRSQQIRRDRLQSIYSAIHCVPSRDLLESCLGAILATNCLWATRFHTLFRHK